MKSTICLYCYTWYPLFAPQHFFKKCLESLVNQPERVQLKRLWIPKSRDWNLDQPTKTTAPTQKVAFRNWGNSSRGRSFCSTSHICPKWQSGYTPRQDIGHPKSREVMVFCRSVGGLEVSWDGECPLEIMNLLFSR